AAVTRYGDQADRALVAAPHVGNELSERLRPLRIAEIMPVEDVEATGRLLRRTILATKRAIPSLEPRDVFLV
ncbi:hypothetical protein NKJ52_30830, partial [Mesorhizobium australicum]